MSAEKIVDDVEINTFDGSNSESKDGADYVPENKVYTPSEIEKSGNIFDRRFIPGIPAYSNAIIQIVMLAFVVFMTPGMYNALSGIGASISGPDGVKTQDNSNVALYCTFAGVGFFAGTICNFVGARSCLIFGGTGYLVYAGSLLSYNRNGNSGFVIFAGAYLGICAACLWAAQGSIIMSYPTEDKKGRAIMIFWVIFNLGAVIGAIIPLANNIHSNSSSVKDSTYIAFMVLMGCGSVIASFMLPKEKVWKEDGTRVVTKKLPSWKSEIFGSFRLLIKEPKILLMFPMFFSSNWFYTYQFNDFNAGRFNVRTRSLNSLLYWFFQMIGAIVIGTILDLKWFKRSTRARIGWTFIFVITLAIWGGGYKFQKGFTRADVTADVNGNIKLKQIDFKDGAYIGPMFLYIFYGILDAMFQSYCLWLMGALSNDSETTAHYAGFYKGVQSAGAAVAWRLDAYSTAYMSMFASSWALVQGSLVIAIPLVFFLVSDYTDEKPENPLDDEEFAPIVALASGEGRIV
ncbi:hypothetical protein C6P40_003126 [Pichia californica]|uniref:DUF895 domain membrane protein n=1 Tax=Pichia californica TaxID=460514 RepID=A0A9P6WJK0_9ASCO|nr:hypothetical protein C6P42_003229 [[Candida] californica]KAG0686948.1 hypothetical protein C6P40_003126 [[Candida] californica]